MKRSLRLTEIAFIGAFGYEAIMLLTTGWVQIITAHLALICIHVMIAAAIADQVAPIIKKIAKKSEE